MSRRRRVEVRNTTPDDFAGIIKLTEATYPGSPPWAVSQLQSHQSLFPEGQLVAIDTATDEVVGMAASLVVRWDDYDFGSSWREFTERGTFINHDPEFGKTLYGAEVMVLPGRRGLGIGKALYQARRDLTVQLGLLRIRAGARLRNYHKVAHRLTAAEYAERIVAGRTSDPTLSFQLRQGFRVLGVVSDYLKNDPESLGWAAVIEWQNNEIFPPSGGQRGDMPAQDIASGPSGTPKLDTTTRAGASMPPGTMAPGAMALGATALGTTANSAA